MPRAIASAPGTVARPARAWASPFVTACSRLPLGSCSDRSAASARSPTRPASIWAAFAVSTRWAKPDRLTQPEAATPAVSASITEKPQRRRVLIVIGP